MQRVTRRVQYLGRVQGVGFRRRAADIALEFPVTGYVKNLPDGSVELVAQGEPVVVSAFLKRVASRMHREITELYESADDGPTIFDNFVIQR